MASSVEWTSQVERMYDSGARVFVEVGPKRALTMFAAQILEGKTSSSNNDQSPEARWNTSFLSALAGIYLSGKDLQWPEPNSIELSEAFRASRIRSTQLSNCTLKYR